MEARSRAEADRCVTTREPGGPDPTRLLVEAGGCGLHWSARLDPPAWRSWGRGPLPAPSPGPALSRQCLAELRPGELRRLGPAELARLPLARARGVCGALAVGGPGGGVLVLEARTPISADEGPLLELAAELARTAEVDEPGVGPGPPVEELGGLLHDLRNQLGLAELELRRLVTDDEPGGGQRGRAALAALAEARELTAELLGRSPERRRRAPLRPWLERELAAALRLAGGGAPRLELRCARELELVAEWTPLARCLRNLVLNALEATPPQGAVRVEARARPAGGVLLEVRDDGPGMSQAELRRCVEPGRSGRGSTGLGLPSVLACVERLRAELQIRSAPGRGTRARILLRDAGARARMPVLRVGPGAVRDGGVSDEQAFDGVEAALACIEAGGVRVVHARRALPVAERARLRARCAARGVHYSEEGLRPAEGATPSS